MNNCCILRQFLKTFVNSSRLLWNFGSTRIPLSGGNLYHEKISVIVPIFTSFVEDFVLCCYQITILFCSQKTSLLFFAEINMNTMLPSLCLHFWSITFRLWVLSLSEECASTCVSKSYRFTVKSCTQTRMHCVGSSLFVSSAGSRCLVALLSWFVSIGYPHACWSLQIVIGRNNVPNFLEHFDWFVDLDVEDKLLPDYDDNLDTTRNTELSNVQIIVFPFLANCGVSPLSTHMNVRVLKKTYKAIEPLAFHQEIDLLRTDRDHEQKRVFLVYLHSRNHGKSFTVFGPSEQSIESELHSPLLIIVHVVYFVSLAPFLSTRE